jgi:hypothetical protein
MNLNLKVIDCPKGRYFYFHVLPAIRNMRVDLKAQIVPLEELKDNSEVGIICGEHAYKDLFKENFLLIDKFLHETVSYSFSEEDVENILEELKCFQR